MSVRLQDPNAILDNPPSKLRGEISIIQHNIGKRQEVQQTLLEVAAKRKADIIAIQEPCTWKKDDNTFFTISHSMFELILPLSNTIRPRVAIYIRKAANFQFRLRLDLNANLDFLAVEFYYPTERFLLFNLYNEKELDQNSHTQQNSKKTI